MRVEVRGIVYESVEECARRLGVEKITVYTALKRGRTECLGLGPGRSRRTRVVYGGKGGGRARPVKYGDLEFESMRAFAEWLGIDRKHLSLLYSRGQGDRVWAMVQARTAALEKKAQAELQRRLSDGIERRHIMGGTR